MVVGHGVGLGVGNSVGDLVGALVGTREGIGVGAGIVGLGVGQGVEPWKVGGSVPSSVGNDEGVVDSEGTPDGESETIPDPEELAAPTVEGCSLLALLF
mmetsp:Transcript_51783/g.125011  ORF Transcript_51783/g.125011 Transcript_51783/m.125011 type:complete len:99 (+) Transcript_51783:1435-1731(+)